MTGPAGVAAAVWRAESARIVGGVLRIVHDVGVAEEVAQDALVAALEQWPVSGVPDNPGAWLTAIAKRRAVDHVRREQSRARATRRLAAGESGRDAATDDADGDGGSAGDDVLRLMFLSCHPLLPPAQRVALTLRVVAGLSAAEIARAFLVAEPVIARRITAAKTTLAESGVPIAMPAGDRVAERLASVLEVVYLIFNEGYAATSGDDLMRPGLCLEALRLGRMLAGLAPAEPEVHGLVALMEIQQSRSAARTGPDGVPVPLHEQNRGRWDRLLIERGFAAMLRARAAGGAPGPYVLQAAIAVCHAQAATAADTNWPQIATLYDALARLLPTPVVRLNRAVAVGFAAGPQAGLDLADELVADPALAGYPSLPVVRGDLLRRLGRAAEARRELERAAALTRNRAEREFLLGRAAELDEPADDRPRLGPAVAEFLARPGVAPATARAYGQTLDRLRRALGDRTPLAELTAGRVAGLFGALWPQVAPRSWNRHRAAVRAFAGWAGLPDLAADVPRRPADRVKRPAPAEPPDPGGAPLRERTLWMLLAESGAPVGAVLGLNVEDLDLDDRRGRSGGRWVGWRSGAARLLPELIGGRARGPLFLADRRPAPARPVADADRCPQTGRRRLSYERAEYLCKRMTGRSLGDWRRSAQT